MRAHLATGLVLMLVAACGPSSGGAAGGDGGGGGGGNGGGGGDNACTNAAECSGDQVCAPSDMVCTSGVGCTTNDECGPGGVCGQSGTCAPNTTGGTCDGDQNCLTGETCEQGHCGCEGVNFTAMPVTPNILIVLDRSNSMNDCPGGAFCNDSKWDVAKDAISQVLSQYGNQVRFGLDMFASNNNCAAGQVSVEVGDNNAATISSAINNAGAASNTPIRATMEALASYNGLKDTMHSNYVLLVSDGGENCDDFSSQPVADLKNQSPSVKTFVVGFGGGVDPDQLNEMATKGGTALPGTTKYFQADDASQLNMALGNIIGSVLSCSYTLDQTPDDLSQLYVYEGGTAVDQDTTRMNGWDYDAATNTLTFYGAACDVLQDGSVTDVSIVYGCASAPPD